MLSSLPKPETKMTKLSAVGKHILLVAAVVFLTAITSGAQQAEHCTVKVTLLQLNDVYQFEAVDQGTKGGLARVMTLRKEIQKESPNTLFLFAGDTISPSVESITHKGAQMIDAWNAAGLDYATFGNHEFDLGPAVLKERMGESKFKWLAANVVDKTTNRTFGETEPFVIREFDGVKVGIFGLVLPDTKITSRPGPDVDFLNPCEVAREMVSRIHAQGAKVVVALTHLSMREDKELARCADVDVVIGGHEHTLLQSAAGGAPIFKMTADSRELGRVDLNIVRETGELDSIDWRIIPVTADIKQDPQFLSVTTKYRGLLRELATRVGRTSVQLNAESAAGRNKETNVGNFVTDAFRKATGAEVAIMNGGSIRADALIGPGVLTKKDVLSILPFKNKVLKLQVTGATLRAALEHGVGRSAEDSEPGRFPQVSGIRFEFDASRQVGSRVIKVTVNGRPLDNDRKYTLATTNFLAIDGGDGYTMFKGAPLLTSIERAPIDAEVLTRAITLAKVIAPKVDGRITRLDKRAGQQTNCQD
jgi:5'-nucleotidase